MGEVIAQKIRDHRANPHAMFSAFPRFAAKVVASDSCWEWTAAVSQFGHGRVRFRGRDAMAHRVAYEIAKGPIPDRMFVCHHCDNPRCVRPSHLFIGTHDDNMRDMAEKGRSRTGSKPHSHCKYGHPLSEANRLRWTDGRARCRTCHERRLEKKRLQRAARGLKRPGRRKQGASL